MGTSKGQLVNDNSFASLLLNESNRPNSGFGKRNDGTSKGSGFLGVLERPDGGISTELSIGVDIDGKEMEIPTLVPTLSKEEISYLLVGNKPTKKIVGKAVNYAKERLKSGKSVFYD